MPTSPIAITGMGCITPCGNSVADLWRNLLEGRSGITRVTRIDTTGFEVHIAGEVKDFDPTSYGYDAKEARRRDLFVLYAVAAGAQAFRQAGLPDFDFDAERAGCIIGTGIGGIRAIEESMDILRKRGPSRVSPLLVPSGTPDVPSNELSLLFGLKGPSFAISTACSSGNDAIIAAARYIHDGAADVMIAGGSESPISELALSSFANLRALSRAAGEPTSICRPFDRGRSGFVLAEGAGALVLESLEHARRRGAHVIALLAGYGQTTDAYHRTAPDPTASGAARAITDALRTAGATPEEVGYVNAHGTSTVQNDPMETLAIKKALGDFARRVPVSSTKSMTGHMIAGAGAVEAIIAVQAILADKVPPTINLEDPDPDCDLYYVPNKAVEARVDVAVSNSFGFGGHNASLVLRTAEE